ncbi:MAG: hypothetical protein K2X69_09770 [Silvanigrellaceae bacterium]|nr:hypothetical protein [Silvanigrellaceae bacterium]
MTPILIFINQYPILKWIITSILGLAGSYFIYVFLIEKINLKKYVPTFFKKKDDLNHEEKFQLALKSNNFVLLKCNNVEKCIFNKKYNVRISIINNEISFQDKIKIAFLGGYSGIEARIQENIWLKIKNTKSE